MSQGERMRLSVRFEPSFAVETGAGVPETVGRGRLIYMQCLFNLGLEIEYLNW